MENKMDNIPHIVAGNTYCHPNKKVLINWIWKTFDACFMKEYAKSNRSIYDYVVDNSRFINKNECNNYTAPFLTYKVTNKNIVKKNSDNSTGVDFNELNSFMNLVTDKAQYHTKRLIDYLFEYSDQYPLYDNPGDGFDTIYPQGYSYEESIYLGRNRSIFSYEEKFEKRKRY